MRKKPRKLTQEKVDAINRKFSNGHFTEPCYDWSCTVPRLILDDDGRVVQVYCSRKRT